MPRVNLGVPERVRELEEEMRSFGAAGGYIAIGELTRYLGYRDRRPVQQMMEGLPVISTGERYAKSRYRVRDVAKRIYELESN